MSFNPTLPVNGAPVLAAELRNQFNALHDETGSILADVTPGTIPVKTGDGALGDSALSEDAATVIVSGKLLSARRSDDANAVLLEIHNGAAPVFHIRISSDGGRICFSSNRGGFSFQTPLDVNGAPVAMKPTGVSALGITVSDPPTQSDVQSIASKLDELINGINS